MINISNATIDLAVRYHFLCTKAAKDFTGALTFEN